MESTKVSQIILALNEKLDPQGLMIIKNVLEKVDDKNYDAIIASISGLKSPTTILIISIFLGQFGVDRFMTGRVGSGVCKLIFGWFTLGIWWLVDVIIAKKATYAYNLQTLQTALQMLS